MSSRAPLRRQQLSVSIFLLVSLGAFLWQFWTPLAELPIVQQAVEKAGSMRGSGSQPTDLDDRYSIIVSTYKRVAHLQSFLDSVATGALPRLDAVFIAWGLGSVDPPDWLALDSYLVPVYLERARVNSLTERFRKPERMRTKAGLWMDDDLDIYAEDIEVGFNVYNEYASKAHRIVGWSGREISYQNSTKSWQYELHQATYSMVLTNAAFLDTTMLEWFWAKDKRMQQSIAYVDEHMNCEDILMNFVVSDRNKLPPILTHSPDIFVVASAGLSAKPGHYRERSHCIDAFAEIWGMPLKSSALEIRGASRELSKPDMPLHDQYKQDHHTQWGWGKKFEP